MVFLPLKVQNVLVFQAWSNGLYKSIKHRAVTNMNKARISIATFLFADDEAEISPVEPMLCIEKSSNSIMLDTVWRRKRMRKQVQTF